jgi:hypothetical protein
VHRIGGCCSAGAPLSYTTPSYKLRHSRDCTRRRQHPQPGQPSSTHTGDAVHTCNDTGVRLWIKAGSQLLLQWHNTYKCCCMLQSLVSLAAKPWLFNCLACRCNFNPTSAAAVPAQSQALWNEGQPLADQLTTLTPLAAHSSSLTQACQ